MGGYPDLDGTKAFSGADSGGASFLNAGEKIKMFEIARAVVEPRMCNSRVEWNGFD